VIEKEAKDIGDGMSKVKDEKKRGSFRNLGEKMRKTRA